MNIVSQQQLADALKQTTKQSHHQLDHHPILSVLLAPTLSCADYARALASLYAPQRFFENLLQPCMAMAHLLPRLPDMQEDLLALYQSPFEMKAPAISSAPSQVQQIGYLYVLEGANLGGVVIARQLAPSLPKRYFNGSGGRARWTVFWDYVNTLLAEWEPSDIQICTEAASRAFGVFQRHLDDCASIPTAFR